MRVFEIQAFRPTWLFLVVFIVLSGYLPAQGIGRILDYVSLVEVRDIGELRVTETIKVHAEGKEIRRGLYRDFPTRYDTPNGKRTTKGFEIISVSRDGEPEPYHL